MKRAFLTTLLLVCAHTFWAQCVASFPYDEDFEAAQAWTVAGTNSDWAWGTPAGTFINSAGGGTKSWVAGGLTGAGYNLSEQAYLLSPCFDFSAMVNPWIQFKIFWECEYHYDGMVLQSTINNGATWVNVGAYGDAVNCLNQNWYNYANINWLTSISVKHGWSGRTQATQGSCQGGNGSLDWVVASHCLNGLAGQPQVQFRFLFGSGTTCNGYDGVALDDIHISEAPTLTPSIQYTCLSGNAVQCSLTTNGCPPDATWDFGDASAVQNTTPSTSVNHSYATAGDYTITATVSGLCYAAVTTSIHIHVLELSGTVVSPSCAGGSDGSITASVVPGNLFNLNYTWSNSGINTSATNQNLQAGNYTVSALADSSCMVTTSFTLTNPLPIQVVLAATNASCGLNDGSVSSVVNNAVGSLNYVWNTPVTQANLLNVGPGNYTLTVTDSLGCVGTANATVNQNAMPPLIPMVQAALCTGDSNGSIACSLGGNENVYTWIWIPNVSSTNTASGLATGSYSVSAGINANCVSSVTVVVPEPLPLIVDAQALSTYLVEGNDASLFSTVSGGTPEYSFGWNPSGATSSDLLFNLTESTTFTLTVTDGNGCVARDTVSVHFVSLASLDSYLFIPTCFTPNADGVNEAFIPVFTNMTSPVMKIFNRWGELIFASTNEQDVWYGQVNNGAYYAEDGVYEYLFTAINLYGTRIERRGHVVLIR